MSLEWVKEKEMKIPEVTQKGFKSMVLDNEFILPIRKERPVIVEPEPEPEPVKVVTVTRIGNGDVYKIEENTEIGRSATADFIIADNPKVSNHHAKIECIDDVYYLTDLNSTNHTYVDGKRVERIELTSGMRFTLANETFLFTITEGE